jgi:hypothetical protein
MHLQHLLTLVAHDLVWQDSLQQYRETGVPWSRLAPPSRATHKTRSLRPFDAAGVWRYVSPRLRSVPILLATAPVSAGTVGSESRCRARVSR